MARLQPINLVRSGDFDTSRSILAGAQAKARRKEKIGENISGGITNFVKVRQSRKAQEARERESKLNREARVSEGQLGRDFREGESALDRASREGIAGQAHALRLRDAELKQAIFDVSGGEVGTVDALRTWKRKQAVANAEFSAFEMETGVANRDPTAIAKGAQGVAASKDVVTALAPTPSTDTRRQIKPPDLSNMERPGLQAVAIQAAEHGVRLKGEEAKLRRQLEKTGKALKASTKIRTPDGADKMRRMGNHMTVLVKKLEANNADQAKLAGDKQAIDSREDELDRQRKIRDEAAEGDRESAALFRQEIEGTDRVDPISIQDQGLNAILKDVEKMFTGEGNKEIRGGFGGVIGEFEGVPDSVRTFAEGELGSTRTIADVHSAMTRVREFAENERKQEVTRRQSRVTTFKKAKKDTLAGMRKARDDFLNLQLKLADTGQQFSMTTGLSSSGVGKRDAEARFRDKTRGDAMNERFFAMEDAIKERPFDEDMLAAMSSQERAALDAAVFSMWNLPAGYDPAKKDPGRPTFPTSADSK